MLKSLYPALLEFAEQELRTAERPQSGAEDVVQDAVRRWIEVCQTERAAKRYLRSAIRGLVANLNREGADAMTHRPLSLDRYPDQIEEM